jgi:hypothetical protein
MTVEQSAQVAALLAAADAIGRAVPAAPTDPRSAE